MSQKGSVLLGQFTWGELVLQYSSSTSCGVEFQLSCNNTNNVTLRSLPSFSLCPLLAVNVIVSPISRKHATNYYSDGSLAKLVQTKASLLN